MISKKKWLDALQYCDGLNITCHGGGQTYETLIVDSQYGIHSPPGESSFADRCVRKIFWRVTPYHPSIGSNLGPTCYDT